MVKRINDSLILKSCGILSWRDQKTGKGKSKYGPLYTHFNETSHKKCDTERSFAQDEDFDYSQISFDKETVKDFNERESTFL